MDKASILTKLSIIIYCGFVFIIKNHNNEAYFTLGILAYVSINMFYHITKRVSLKNILLTLSLILLVFCFVYINAYFILLLPISIYEITIGLKQKPLLGALVVLIVCFFAYSNIRADFMLIALLCFFIVHGFYITENKIKHLLNEVDGLRDKNAELNSNLHRDLEHEAQVKYSSQLEERNKIAQEIHDNIGHTLSGSIMQLEAAKMLIELDEKKSKDMISNTIDVLRAGMESIRATLRNIKPPAELLGINKIKLDLDSFTNNSVIKANLIHKGDLEVITYAQWNIMRQNIKEALTNTIKYSKASWVTIDIEILNKFVKVEVRDNGQGSYNIKKGLGLKGIEERCEGLGGKVIIDGSKGFSIIMLLPVAKRTS